MIIEAKPNTELRDYAICALSDEGLAGPNYSLDDISATITINGDTIHVSFWDTSRYIGSNNKYYKKLKELAKNSA